MFGKIFGGHIMLAENALQLRNIFEIKGCVEQ